jgi:hypothetical protein
MSKEIIQRNFSVDKKKQRNSSGVPLRARRKRGKKIVTLRQPLLGIITHLRMHPKNALLLHHEMGMTLGCLPVSLPLSGSTSEAWWAQFYG